VKYFAESRCVVFCVQYDELLTFQTLRFTLRTASFKIQKVCVLPTIYVFCVDLRTNSDYFPIQH